MTACLFVYFYGDKRMIQLAGIHLLHSEQFYELVEPKRQSQPQDNNPHCSAVLVPLVTLIILLTKSTEKQVPYFPEIVFCWFGR